MAVTHAFTSTIEDGADNTLVQPSDWNAAHTLSNALGAIDALTPAASKIPYFTGAAAATLADITATGVSLLGVADAAAGRTALGLGTIATQAASNVSLTGGSISGMTSIGGTLLSLASDSGAEHVFCKTNDTSNSNQSCVFALRHYSSAAEEAATAFRMVSESGVNQLYLGGGALNHNACTMIKFYTASNNTTLTGSERGRVTNDGRLLWGTTTDDGASLAQFAGDVKTTSGSFLLGTTASISTSQIGPVTTDGSDTASFSIRGGGSAAATRGSFIACYGNEHETSPGQLSIVAGSGSIILYTGSGNIRSKILSTGEFLINQSNSIDTDYKLQVGGPIYAQGLKLDGTVSSDVNTLDYYKEGTFTPVVYGTTTAGTGVYSTQLGRYTRIGDTVFVTINLYWTEHDGTGNMNISGLPFYAKIVQSVFSVFHSAIQGLDGKTIKAFMAKDTNYIRVVVSDEVGGAGYASLPMDASGVIQINGHYFV